MKTSGGLIVLCPEDCGNSPKKEMLKKFNIAFAENDRAFILENIADDFCWSKIGDRQFKGKEAVEKTLSQMADADITELHIHNIITHGRSASINGELVFENKKRIAFCDVCTFTGAGKNSKMKEMTSYVIDLD
ncbi:nuclear transport factor 2 family protein [Pseudalkalibacillus sp. R45]|uniref:nuclear transport factor 2 family protein n=1 Tax=Pseudalkalibacillus sp. R45 TaxID=3457433 RepID=UPI003FCD4568